MPSKVKKIFYLRTVPFLFIYPVLAHLLRAFSPNAIPVHINSLPGYVFAFCFLISILSVLGFVFKKQLLLKVEKLTEKADEKIKQTFFMKYFMVTQSSVMGIQTIGFIVFLVINKIFPVYLLNILSVPFILIIYKDNIALVKKHFSG